jgi:hypothetical protein
VNGVVTWLLSVLIGMVVIAVGLMAKYISGLPARIHAENAKRHEFSLAHELEEFKSELARESESRKISQSGLQLHKTTEFVRLIEFLIGYITDPKKTQRLASDPKAATEFNKTFVDLGVKLFFFASDETIRAYVEWRMHGLMRNETASGANMHTLVLLANLVMSMRRDLGYGETSCTPDDVLNIMLTDWEIHRATLTTPEL